MGRLPAVLLRFTVKLKIALGDAVEQSLLLSFCSFLSLSAEMNKGNGSIFFVLNNALCDVVSSQGIDLLAQFLKKIDLVWHCQ